MIFLSKNARKKRVCTDLGYVHTPLPPDRTIIIEGHFQTKSTNRSQAQKIRNVIRHRIMTTCGDNDIEYDNRKKADPTLCLYAGINLICVTNNKDMEQDPPRGNGLVVKFISAKNQTKRKLTQMERLQREKGLDSQCKRCGIHHSRIY